MLSKGNTLREMNRKLDEFSAPASGWSGTSIPGNRTVRVYTACDHCVVLSEDQQLDGGDVLPGFSLSIRDWFNEAERTGPR